MNPQPPNIKTVLAQARDRLASHSDTPGLDAQVLLGQVMGAGRAWLLAHGEAFLSSEQAAAFETALAKLENGEPLPYLLGEWEFYGLQFVLTPDVLIPRPETELLVEQALDWLASHPDRRRVADVGTGSGCIGIVLAMQAPTVSILATDISFKALQVARLNMKRYTVQTRIKLCQSDLLYPFDGRFDLVCANLPYVPRETLRGLKVYGHEPTLALDGGPDGLDFIRRLLEDAPRWMAAGGRLLLEIEASQGGAARQMSTRIFPNAKIEVLADLAGHPRLLVADL